ncbi:helix-turn-helix transcriptional regulator [Kineosporia sp. J2-2]|uniref:Helix-turn-helix transcriptional regulator n=1 Tax=Kineosporia corallincola TaxID=2835133 RepID=A0ABS5TED0_9ACTN|nr:helix-turn-helix transcriptional regulator [Kineosporia corallincola]MBT0768581.1 helix-turn-helix transcriptional regulator [Kineosporia corallincola]
MPAAEHAGARGEYGAVLRTARVAAGLTLQEAAALAGVSASTLSRMETNPRRHWDVGELRRLSRLFAIPPHLFGLAALADTLITTTLGPGADEEGDGPMRRREMLTTTAAAIAGLAPSPPQPQQPAPGMATSIEDVLLGRFSVPAISDQQLAAQLAAARADFHQTHYHQLARRLPRLLAQATAARDAAPLERMPSAHGRLAQAYSLSTQLLIKLHDNGMAWATADRAVQNAALSHEPTILAEARRMAATAMRRSAHPTGAQRLMLDAAHDLRVSTGLTQTAPSLLYGQILAAASYTAALREDRDNAWGLLNEADTAICHATRTRPAGPPPTSSHLDLAVYKISISRVLGDYGTALDHARRIDPSRITSPERRARYWEDTALSLHGRGRPEAAFAALQAAEHDTPQEVRLRPWAQRLTTDLLTRNNHSLPGLRDFATRIGAH